MTAGSEGLGHSLCPTLRLAMFLTTWERSVDDLTLSVGGGCEDPIVPFEGWLHLVNIPSLLEVVCVA